VFHYNLNGPSANCVNIYIYNRSFFSSWTASSQVTGRFTPYTVTSSSKSAGFSHQLLWS